MGQLEMARHEVDVVTGGAGFIGSHLVRGLLECGRSVRVIDNLSTGKLENLEGLDRDFPGRFEFIRADIRDRDALTPAFEGARRVFHQAAMVSVQKSVEDPQLCHDINVTGTLKVLETSRSVGVEKVVFASTCAIYGDDPELPKRESMAPAPKSPYAATKYMDEVYARLFGDLYGFPVVALRYFNVFGPGQDPASDYAAVIPKFITRMIEGRAPIIFGDGEQTRDFIFVGNIVQANLAAAERAPAGTVLNIGSGERYSLNELVSILNDVLRADYRPEYREARSGDVRHSLADVTSAEEKMGFRAQTGFREGLAETVRYFVDCNQKERC
jgi:UDP-glucose 4-epimerase